MTDRFRMFAARSLALASLAYAAKMKRAGLGNYGVAVAALVDDNAQIIYSGPMPATLRRVPSSARDCT